jgi:putative membrane protein
VFALALAVGCGGAPDAREGGGGADGFGDDARPTAAERSGATGDSNRGGTVMGSLSDEDRQFVQKASLSNRMEVALGNLAEDKAQSDEVKQFGEQLARDHEAANRELQSSIGGGDATTAQQPGAGVSNLPERGVTTAEGRDRAANQGAQGGDLSTARQQMEQTQQKLESVSGAAFDRAYLEEMVNHHQHDIQEFERAAQSDNPQVRAFAERTLPTLRQHLQQAQQLQNAARGSRQ